MAATTLTFRNFVQKGHPSRMAETFISYRHTAETERGRFVKGVFSGRTGTTESAVALACLGNPSLTFKNLGTQVLPNERRAELLLHPYMHPQVASIIASVMTIEAHNGLLDHLKTERDKHDAFVAVDNRIENLDGSGIRYNWDMYQARLISQGRKSQIAGLDLNNISAVLNYLRRDFGDAIWVKTVGDLSVQNGLGYLFTSFIPEVDIHSLIESLNSQEN